MPAIQVARTDTFEQQRVKINQIGDQIFTITEGGSDLATGNLKLGDGTLSSPSLSFTSDNSLGIYKPDNNTIGFASSGKRTFDIFQSALYAYKDFYVQRNYLTDANVSILSSGSGYESGTYSDVTLLGGSGEGATVSINVEAFNGSILSAGVNYIPGVYNNIELEGGSALANNRAVANIIISEFEGSITNAGSNYGFIDPETGSRTIFYSDVPLTNGSGTGAEAEFILDLSTGEVSSITITNPGQNYVSGDIVSVNNSDLGGSGSGFLFTLTKTPGFVEEITFSDKGVGYQQNDILTLPTGVSNVSTTLDNTSSVITIPDASEIQSGYIVEKVSGDGELAPNTSVILINDNELVLFPQPTVSGSVVLNFIPAFGSGTTPFQYQVNSLGIVDTISILDGGNGYNVDDLLSISPQDVIQETEIIVTVKSVEELTFVGSVSSGTFSTGDLVRLLDGSLIAYNVTSSTTVLSAANNTYSNVAANSTTGIGYDAQFEVVRDNFGTVVSVNATQPGFQYSSGDQLTIPGNLVGGSAVTDDITIEVTFVTQNIEYEIFAVGESAGNTDYIICESLTSVVGDKILKSGSTIPYEILSTTGSNKYFIDYGNGEEIFPNLTLYSGETYRFDLSDPSVSGHPLAFSRFRDGIWSPSRIENISTTLSILSKQITVSSTSNILEGMAVFVSSGTGNLSQTCLVESVDNSTTITLTELPIADGSAILTFTGTEYTDGVTRESSFVLLKVSDTTPSLYYYCGNHPDMAGSDGNEATITIDTNNPRSFGSGFVLKVNSITQENVVEVDSKSGLLKSSNLETNDINCATVTSSGSITSLSLDTNIVYTEQLSTSSTLEVFSSSTNFNSDVTIGSNFTVSSSNGDLTTSGIIKTLGSLNVNNKLLIENNIISSFSGNDLVLTPFSGRVAKVDSTTALVIPSGATNERPTGSVLDGSIRFNTTTNQYEGYSSATSSWSSLGGVRDLDGNTTILAEETIGANDNTLWFYNDNINTLKLTTKNLEFKNVKSITSSSITAPQFIVWVANSPVTLGQYVKYRNNLYEVTVAGTTGTPGAEPVHTSGALPNGTAELTWSQLAVAPLIFEDIEVIRIGPLGGLPLSINSDLRLANNVLSTDISDLIIRPNSGKKVIIDANTTLVIPSGVDADRGIPSQGSVRFSTTSNQFEGYDGTNWGSLGGVKDVNQNTYIIPELSPGSDENILYFYNDNNNTLQLTTTSLDFYSIDTIKSTITDELEITASLLTIDNGALNIDNTETNRTFINTTKQYFDLGLSSGLNTDPVLRLDDQGDVFLNIGFGTGVFNGVKVFDGDLKEFELSDIKILTEKLTLIKGTSDSGSSIIYAVASNAGAKTTIIAENPTSGDKEFIEFGILDDGTDVFHTEYGNIRTGTRLIIPTFEVTGAGNVRINISLGSGVNPTEAVNITVVSNVTKK